MRTPDELTTLFRERGYKVTPQRQLIFRILHGSEVHPTAEAVYTAAAAQMPTISLRTVYQTLNDLTAMDEIHQIDLGTGSHRFDPNVDQHHHLVCTSCGKIRDLYVDVDQLAVPAGVGDDFHVQSTEVVFRGVCDACTELSTTPQPPQPKEAQPDG